MAELRHKTRKRRKTIRFKQHQSQYYDEYIFHRRTS